MDAESIADTIVSTVKQWRLDTSYIVGQGYNGAALMSSSKNGVWSKIAQYPNATYVHCCFHVFNLALSNECTAVMSIRNPFDSVKLTWFLSDSGKILLEITADADDDLLDPLTAEQDDDLGELSAAIKVLKCLSISFVPYGLPE